MNNLLKTAPRPYEISFFSIFTFALDIQPSRSAMARLPCMQQGEVQGELRHLHEIPGNHFPIILPIILTASALFSRTVISPTKTGKLQIFCFISRPTNQRYSRL